MSATVIPDVIIREGLIAVSMGCMTAEFPAIAYSIRPVSAVPSGASVPGRPLKVGRS